MVKLPTPDSIALNHSKKLTELIRQEIVTAGGRITFARFMELGLYAPGLGYYSAGARKFGEAGDFVTAPEISPLFGRCLAQQCQQILSELGNGSILELGAGSGRLACDILLELERQEYLPEKYFILEVSADLRERQKSLLKQEIPHLFDRVEWLNNLPQAFCGITLANEVMDALSVHKFRWDGEVLQEFYVAWKNDQFVWQLAEPSTQQLIEKFNELINENFLLLQKGGRGDFYESEINLLLPAWIKSLSECLEKGVILLIDYGFPRTEFYHFDRFMGTLMCHYRHRSHTDPLILVGLQDITAHVDFTTVAESAVGTGLHVAGFATQAAFLLSSGLLELASEKGHDKVCGQISLSRQIQQLTSPAEMGELFKVIALTKYFDGELLGFGLQDWRIRL